MWERHVANHAQNRLAKFPLFASRRFKRGRPIISHAEELENIEGKEAARPNLNVGDFVAVKDNFVTSHLPTTCASSILLGFKTASQSTVTQLLQDAGLEVVAKTNMDEFGMGSHSTNSAFGPVYHGTGRLSQSAGGSSGGSALAVADQLSRFAIGSDTGGSVRLPAAYTGIVGFKPSYGRISRNGLVPYANSLDTVGLFASNIKDISSLYKILDKYDHTDPTSLSQNTRLRIQHTLLQRGRVPGASAQESIPLRPVATVDRRESHQLTDEAKEEVAKWNVRDSPPRFHRIGVPDEYNIAEMHPYVRRAWLRSLSALQTIGHEIVPISLPTTRAALAAYYVLAPAEASSNLAKYDGVRYGTPRNPEQFDDHSGPLYAQYRGANFGQEVKRRILLGTFTLSAEAMDNYFIQAQKVRRLVQQDFNNAFALKHPLIDSSHYKPDGVDFIVVPTAPNLPPLISELDEATPLDSYINDVFTVPASLAGLPAISVPVVADEDMPRTPDRNIGMQIIGQYGDDTFLLSFARHTLAALDLTAGTTNNIERRVWN